MLHPDHATPEAGSAPELPELPSAAPEWVGGLLDSIGRTLGDVVGGIGDVVSELAGGSSATIASAFLESGVVL